MHTGECSELFGTHRRARRRHLGALVPGQQTGGSLEVGDLAERQQEVFEGAVHDCNRVPGR